MLASRLIWAGDSIEGGSPISCPKSRCDTPGRQRSACRTVAQTPAPRLNR
jgi:hypothetical protein